MCFSHFAFFRIVLADAHHHPVMRSMSCALEYLSEHTQVTLHGIVIDGDVDIVMRAVRTVVNPRE